MKQVQDHDATVEKIYLVVGTVLNKDGSQLAPDASQETEEDWDSLNQLRIIAGLEDAFTIEFSDEQVMGLVSLPALIEAVFQLLATRTGDR